MNLVKERLDRGFSIRGLAQEIGVAEQVVRRLEEGLPVRPASAKKVADFYDCKVTDLMPLKSEAASA